ncbi:MAG TPA: hypothetical protein PLA50_13710, partial [Bacteroidia bacterium]|nr:hypothetical protein [Bacteroidia bacterium]
MPFVVPEHHQEDGALIGFVEQVIGKISEIDPAQAAWIEMVAFGISLDRGQHGIQLGPKGGKHVLGDFRIVHRRTADILGKLGMPDDPHFLGSPASLPKVLLGQALDFAGLQILKALQSLLVTDVVRTGIEILEEGGNQFHTFKSIQLGRF